MLCDPEIVIALALLHHIKRYGTLFVYKFLFCLDRKRVTTLGTHFHSIFPNEDFLDLKPYQYGWEECVPLHSFGPFIRNHYLFHYIISGQGVLYSHAVNGEIHEYRLEANEGFFDLSRTDQPLHC